MEEISNRALAVLLVAAIIISLGGTIISLNKISQLRWPGAPPVTGMATTQDTGEVNLTVGGEIFITTTDNPAIEFGSCTPRGQFEIINSEIAGDGSDTSSVCSSYTSTDNITVRNYGNVNVNVSFTTTDCGEDTAVGCGGSFIPSDSAGSYIAWKAFDGYASPYGPGCRNNTIIGINSSSWGRYTNISSKTASTSHRLCANLTFGESQNSVGMHIQIGIPNDAQPTKSNITFNFLAQQADI